MRAAYDIARFTAEDPAAGLPDAAGPGHARRGGARPRPVPPLGASTPTGAAELARRCEDAALRTDRRITNSEGAGVSAQQSHFWAGNSRGFRGGYASSRHSHLGGADRRQGRGHAARRLVQLDARRDASWPPPEAVGRYAAERALSRLKSRKVATCEVPVLFETPLAAGLLGAYVQATSGGALYRKASFLLDSLGTAACWPDHLDVDEDPHLLRGQGQRAVRRRRRAHARAPGGRGRRGAGLLPVQLLGAQARACAPPATPAARRT